MSLLVSIPATWKRERKYAIDVVLGSLLGQPYVVTCDGHEDVVLRHAGRADDGKLSIADAFFSHAEARWLDPASLPIRPLEHWSHGDTSRARVAVEPGLPIIYGRKHESGAWFVEAGQQSYLGLDVFGSAFFMLTRYEELVKAERDEHERFPAAASLAYQEGFLERPIVNEYAEILWACMKRLWPWLERPRRQAQTFLSHDVDWPLLPEARPRRLLLNLGGDFLKRRHPGLALQRLRAYARRRRGDHTLDPHNTFDLLMNTSEEHGVRSAFYFIAGHSGGTIDGEYTLDDPFIRNLMRRIHERGHEIGLHPSYHTFRDGRRLEAEFHTLLRAADALGIQQDAWGGRQHYLRWEAPTTWRSWDRAGLAYDASVGYADHVGFRTGTCDEHPVFDPLSSRVLSLLERPLAVMEATLLSKLYMGLAPDEATRRIEALTSRCRRLGGAFSLLWHNNHFIEHRAYPTLYRRWIGLVTRAAGDPTQSSSG